MATLLPTYDSIIAPYCQGSNAPGQVSNWVVHGSYATDRFGFVFPSGASGAGKRLLKVSGPGSQDEWWMRHSFICPTAAEWPGDTWGNSIYNWHNVSGDLGWGDTYNGVADPADPTSPLHIFFKSLTKVESTLAAPFAPGDTTLRLANSTGFRTATGQRNVYIGTTTKRDRISYAAVSGNDLTGTSSGSQSWPAGTVVQSAEDGLVYNLQYDGYAGWALPNPTPGQRYDIVHHVIFGRTDGSTARPGLVELYVNGSDTKIVNRQSCNNLQRTTNYYKTPGLPYTQQFIQFWEGGPYILEQPGRGIAATVWKHRHVATQYGTTFAEATADMPVLDTVEFWLTHGTISDANGVTHYGTQNNHIAGYPDYGPCRINEDWSAGTLTPYSVAKLTADAFQVPPSLGGGGAPPSIPAVVAAPAVTGTTSPGNTLTCSQGIWSGSPTSYAYQWQYSYDRQRPVVLTGATAATLALTGAHTGFVLRCQVTATNAAGSVAYQTAWTSEIDSGVAGSYAPNGGAETAIPPWGGALGTETVTRDTVVFDAGASSAKAVCPGAARYEGLALPVGQGILCPAGEARTFTVRYRAPNLATVRISIGTYDSNDQLVRESATATLTANGSFQTAPTIAVPAPAADAWQRATITTGATIQAITINADVAALTTAAAATGLPSVYDSTGPHKANAGSITFARTIPAGLVNGCLYTVASYDDKNRAVSAATLNGVAGVRVALPAPTGGGNVEIWRWKAASLPAAGTYNVVVTNTLPVQYVVGTVLMQDVNQTTPEGTPATDFNTTTHPQLAIASSPSEVVIGGIAVGSNGGEALDADANQSDKWNSRQYTTYGITGAGTVKAGDASATVGWVITGRSSPPWTAAAVTVKGVAGGAAPANTTIPVISGTPTKGQLLTISDGVWTGSPTSLAYQWYRDQAGTGAYSAIAFATDRNYTPTVDDLACHLRADVAAANANGVTVSTATAVGPVAGIAPTLVTAPQVFGPNTVGSRISVDTGVWNDNPTSYTYQWQHDIGAGFVNYGGTVPAYLLLVGDIGAVFRCIVTATNAIGSTPATSTSSPAIVAAPAVVALRSRAMLGVGV